MRHGGWVFADHTCNRDRIAGLGQHARRALNRLWCGDTARRRHAWVGSVCKAGALLGNDLAWQGEIDWPLRLATGEREGTVDNPFQVHTGTQLVVPLHPLADHRALIEGLLRPMN